MDISVNLIYHPLYVLGSGRRVGIWFQGCSLRCSGCISKHTWDRDKGELYSVEELAREVLSYGSSKVTITGGEPFEQPKALKALLEKLRDGGVSDILVYSGFSYAYLQKRFKDILKLIDAMVVGRFDKNLPTKFVYKGSKNQEMIILNTQFSEEYLEYKKETKRRLQVVDGYILGIPLAGDLVCE